MSNDAQRGGAKIATGIQVATGVGAVVKTGVKASGRMMVKAGRKKVGSAVKDGGAAGDIGLTGESAKGGALTRTPDFVNKQRAFEHYAKHVKGIELKNGKAKLIKKGIDLPELSSFDEYIATSRKFHSGPPGKGVLEGVRVRNPVFLDRQSGFDWTEIPVLSGQWFSVFLPAVVAV